MLYRIVSICTKAAKSVEFPLYSYSVSPINVLYYHVKFVKTKKLM